MPSCPPGLFTKQFVERAALDPLDPARLFDEPPHTTTTFPESPQPINDNSPPAGTRRRCERLPDAEPHLYPFLTEKFYFTADGQDASDNLAPRVGGPTGAGWHKMLELFEVPSPVLGAIGPVIAGENRDWFREAARPGLINPNLIIDEEVFFGLIDDARLNLQEIRRLQPGPPRRHPGRR